MFRQLTPPQRHSLIFDTYGKLNGGEGFILINDHNPKPLYYQFQAERPSEVSWEYIERWTGCLAGSDRQSAAN